MSATTHTCPQWCVADDHHGAFPEEPALHSGEPWLSGSLGTGEARISLQKVDGAAAHIDVDAGISVTAEEARAMARALVEAAARLEESR